MFGKPQGWYISYIPGSDKTWTGLWTGFLDSGLDWTPFYKYDNIARHAALGESFSMCIMKVFGVETMSASDMTASN